MEFPAHKFLDELNIPYEKKTFPETTEKGAANVANALGFRPRQMVKTLIMKTGEGELIMILVGGDQNAASSLLKKTVGSRDVKMAEPEEIKELTGYIIGSIPPFSWQKENFRSFIDQSLMNEEELGVGAGVWGNEIIIKPENLVKASKASIVNLIKAEKETIVEIKSEELSKYVMKEESSKGDLKNYITIKSAKDFIGQEVTLKGWLYNKRSSGKIAFLQLRDGTGFIQGIVEKGKVDEKVWVDAEKISIESSVSIVGVVSKHPSKDEYELQVKELEIVGGAEEYPIGKKEHGPDFLFDNRDLYLRSKTPWAILRIRNQVFLSITNFFAEQDFIRFDTPILQPTSCEDTTQLFGLKYYEDKMYLTQSGQLYLEAGIMGFGKAYDFGPVFRAEKSKTRNHLSEFWMMDAEMAFHDQSMNEDVQEGLIKRIIKDCLENCKLELEILERDTTIMQDLLTKPFVRMKHYDAKKLLEEKGFEVDYNDDMTTEEEIEIGNIFKVPVFIEDYPFAVKAFYMKKYTDERGMERARNADLIAPEEAREIIGGSQREEDYESLLAELKARDYSLEDYEWYLNIRKYGAVVHSGFGVGLERVVRWISGTHHIRETIPFPRTMVLKRP
jgi:asparaginyl-tRNA synthetase